MDLHEIVEAVAAHIQHREDRTPWVPRASLLPSLHSETMERVRNQRAKRKRYHSLPLEYRYATAHILDEWNRHSTQPITFDLWQGAAAAGDGAFGQCERLHRLHRELYAITERYAPGVMTAPAPRTPEAGGAPTSVCPMCGSDVPIVASGACVICSAALCDSPAAVAEPPPPPLHAPVPVLSAAAVVAAPVPGSPPPPAADEPRLKHRRVERDHSSVHTGAAAVASNVIYQRRVQFRQALSAYQGRAIHEVPREVLDDVRDQLETSVRHLINVAATDPRERYASVTRVHVLTLMRSPGSGPRFSRWYRESHAIHAALTLQPPPDISEHESLLLLLFDAEDHAGRSERSDFFILVRAVWKVKLKNKKVHNGSRPMPTRADLIESRPDGNKIFMVAFELCTLLFTLVYAFPHIPTTLVDEAGLRQVFNWTQANTMAGLRDIIRGMLRTSDVLEASRPGGIGAAAAPTGVVDELEAVCDPRTLSKRYRLNLYDDAVPLTTRQMIEALCRVYDNIFKLELSTRDDLLALLRHHRFIPNNKTIRPDASANRTQSALLQFCTELAVDWMQPYFARDVRFYIPPGIAASAYEKPPTPSPVYHY